MAEFTPIETQEDFDRAISKRIERATRTAEEKYKDYISPEDYAKRTEGLVSAEDHAKLKSDNESLTQQISELNKTIRTHQISDLKRNIAREVGLSYGFESRLTGETEEDIRKDAESLKALIGNNTRTVVPLASKETAPADSKSAAYSALLSGMKK